MAAEIRRGWSTITGQNALFFRCILSWSGVELREASLDPLHAGCQRIGSSAFREGSLYPGDQGREGCRVLILTATVTSGRDLEAKEIGGLDHELDKGVAPGQATLALLARDVLRTASACSQ